jgi:hypothetical protein
MNVLHAFRQRHAHPSIREVLLIAACQDQPPRAINRWHNGTLMNDNSICHCASCGEEIVVGKGAAAGTTQEYVKDCPVCRHPNIIHVEIETAGDVHAWVTED